MPNGLIFAVIVAIWCAYFVQYWIRRREHLATARSMDRFSASMRVLSRRNPLPETSLVSPGPRVASVTPARSMRPQILVKRAGAVGTDHRNDSLYSTGGRGSLGSPGRIGTDTFPMTRQEAAPMPMTSPPARRVPRKVRGLTLLGCLGLTLVLTVVAALGVVPWWSSVVALAATVGAFLWLRSAVQADIAARRVSRDAGRETAASSDAAGPEHQPNRQSGRGYAARPATAAAGRVTHPATPMDRAGEHVVDEDDAAEAPAVGESAATAEASRPEPAGPTAPLVDEDDMPLTWDPRPVPPPTYTLKESARHALPEPAATTPSVAFDDEDGAGQGSAYEDRRVAGA